MSQEYSGNLPGRVIVSTKTLLYKSHLVPKQWIIRLRYYNEQDANEFCQQTNQGENKT